MQNCPDMSDELECSTVIPLPLFSMYQSEQNGVQYEATFLFRFIVLQVIVPNSYLKSPPSASPSIDDQHVINRYGPK